MRCTTPSILFNSALKKVLRDMLETKEIEVKGKFITSLVDADEIVLVCF